MSLDRSFIGLVFVHASRLKIAAWLGPFWNRALTADAGSAILVFCLLVAFVKLSMARAAAADSSDREGERLHWLSGSRAVMIYRLIGWSGVVVLFYVSPHSVIGLNWGTAILLDVFAATAPWRWDRLPFIPRQRDMAGTAGEASGQQKSGRALRSLIAAFLVMTLFFCFLEWRQLIPRSGGSVKLSALTGTGIEINYETSKGNPESVAIVSVPAYRMASPTGVLLHPGDLVEISASGLITTSLAFNWFGDDPIVAKDTKSYLEEAMRRAEFNIKSYPDWRDPKGDRIYLNDAYEKGTPNQEIYHEDHERFKLMPDQNYGCLLGCVLTRAGVDAGYADVAREVLTAWEKKGKNAQLFPIGKKLSIQCLKRGDDEMTLHFVYVDNDVIRPLDIHIHGLEGQLVLLINDVVVTKAAIAKLTSDAKGPEFAEDEWMLNAIQKYVFDGKQGLKLNQYQKLPTNQKPVDHSTPSPIDDGLRVDHPSKEDPTPLYDFTNEIWFWDNSGIFTAIIKKTSKADE